MPSAGFKPAVLTMKGLHTYALDSMATGIGTCIPSCVGCLFIDRALPVQRQMAFAIQFSTEIPTRPVHEHWICGTL